MQDYTAPMDTALSSLKCLIGGLQKSVDDGAPALFGIRSLPVHPTKPRLGLCGAHS